MINFHIWFTVSRQKTIGKSSSTENPPANDNDDTLRSRDHIEAILNEEMPPIDDLPGKLNKLKDIYKQHIQPLSKAYKFHNMGYSPISGNSLLVFQSSLINCKFCHRSALSINMIEVVLELGFRCRNWYKQAC